MAFVVLFSLGPVPVSAAEDAEGGMAALGECDNHHPRAWLACDRCSDRRRMTQAVHAIHGLLHAPEMLSITSQQLESAVNNPLQAGNKGRSCQGVCPLPHGCTFPGICSKIVDGIEQSRQVWAGGAV